MNFGRKEANEHRKFYGESIPCQIIIDRISMHVQYYTIQSYLRPYGVSAVIGGHDRNGYHLFMVEPSGVSFVCYLIDQNKNKNTFLFVY